MVGRREIARRAPGYPALLLISALVGVGGGVLAAVYAYLLQGMLFAVWHGLARVVGPIWLITALGGLLVGLSLRFLGVPGEIAAVVNNIHMRNGRLNVRETPSMVVNSLLSISFGGSAGPEAPLVQIIGSLGSWLGERLRLYDELVRTLTFCGMAAALGAFFGAPLGGALFALEIPHRRGMEYYEALLPSLVAAFLSFWVFRALVPGRGILYPLPVHTRPTVRAIGLGAGLGVLGAAVGVGFIGLFRVAGRALHRVQRWRVALAVAGGLAIGLVATAFPGELSTKVLFWGELQAHDLLVAAPALAAQYGSRLVFLLVLMALAKGVSIALTLHSGFRGGFIFPLFFIGAALGMALSFGTGGAVPLAVATLCLMAALNVAVTRTPISTIVILTTLSGTSMIPVIAAASTVSFVLTTPVPLIRTQRSRRHGPARARPGREAGGGHSLAEMP